MALKETVERAPPGVQLITVADRESDFFEFLTQAQEQRAHFLVRARTDRLLVPEESEGYESILESLGSAKVLGTVAVKIPANGKRKARRADIEAATAAALFLPASVAILGLERNTLKALYPVALGRMVRGLGPMYLWMLAVIALYAVAFALLAKLWLWLPVQLLLGMFAVLSVFSTLGGSL